MCGIIGAVSTREISKILLEGLRRLEYRGYDSAGIVLLNTSGDLQRVRALGKVQKLADAMEKAHITGTTGIAHTRWATHGKPSELNAHPHCSHNELAIVHNGIIENYETLRPRLLDAGYTFESDTDSEVAAHLIHYHYTKTHDLLTAVQHAMRELHGAFALGVIDKKNPEQLIAVRQGSPLVIGLGITENFIASDPLALRAFAQSVIYLEEGDTALISSTEITCFDINGTPVERETHPLRDNHAAIGKGVYRHFMLKEIMEQPNVLRDTMEGRLQSLAVLRNSFGEGTADLFNRVKHIHIIACGTSYHAGMVARYWLESLAGIRTQVEIASEYRYRDVVVDENTLFITISQSGETADTLAALSKAKQLGYLATFAICNVAESSLVRESDFVFLTRAGVEIGVASTKAFTTQLTALLMLTTALCRDERAEAVLEELRALPTHIKAVLEINKEIEAIAPLFTDKAHALFLGRGVQYPVALEGALKLKEISYIHAEAYPAGELKHGPLALVDREMPVIAIAPNDELLDKIKSNLHEVSARGGALFVFADSTTTWTQNTATLILVPANSHWTAPIRYTIPLQLLAYHVAVVKGTDVDQPRNLAKSVTVE